MKRVAGLLTTVACAVVAASSPAAAEEKPGVERQASSAEQAELVQAIWKEQEITFYFQSFTTFYTCSSLEASIERIIRELGARDVNVNVRSADCPSRVARVPYVRIEMTAPVLATPEAIAERNKGKSTRELAARVKGERAEGTEATDQFAAQWRDVSLTRGSLRLESGDCELVEELRRKVLPKMAVRIVEDDTHCSPGQVSVGQPRLKVQALVEAPKPDDPVTPGAGGGDSNEVDSETKAQ